MLLSEADSIRQAANAQQQELLGKQEEIVRAVCLSSFIILNLVPLGCVWMEDKNHFYILVYSQHHVFAFLFSHSTKCRRANFIPVLFSLCSLLFSFTATQT